VETFFIDELGEIKDKNHLYFVTKDFALSALSHYQSDKMDEFYTDNDSVYFQAHVRYYPSKIENLDKASFEIIGKDHKAVWIKDKDKILVRDFSSGNWLEINADRKSFKPLSWGYSKDKEGVWFFDKLVTYEKWDYCENKENQKCVNSQIALPADPKTFSVHGGWAQAFATDAKGVFIQGWYLEDADINTFKHISRDYFEDKKNLYYMENKIENSDRESFEVINRKYSKDKNKVYYKGKEMKVADPKTFTQITDPSMGLTFDYAKDSNFVYIENKRLNGANPETFDWEKYEREMDGVYDYAIFPAEYDVSYAFDIEKRFTPSRQEIEQVKKSKKLNFRHAVKDSLKN
jgi:hypothetical protein